MATPWLFTLGFTIIFSVLFSKIWRINILMASAAKFRRVQVNARDVLLPMAVLLALNIVFMTVWTAVDPMFFQRSQRCGSDAFTSFGNCVVGAGPVSVAMAGSVAGVNFLAIVLANIQAFKARKINTEFSESSSIGLAMGSMMQIFIVGIPLVFLVNDSPPAKYFILVSMISVICFSVLLLMFVPKMRAMSKFRKQRREAIARGEAFDEKAWWSKNAGVIKNIQRKFSNMVRLKSINPKKILARPMPSPNESENIEERLSMRATNKGSVAAAVVLSGCGRDEERSGGIRVPADLGEEKEEDTPDAENALDVINGHEGGIEETVDGWLKEQDSMTSSKQPNGTLRKRSPDILLSGVITNDGCVVAT